MIDSAAHPPAGDGNAPRVPAALAEQLRLVGARSDSLGRLVAAQPDEQRARGYYDTLREICQQPITWPATADRVARVIPALAGLVASAGIRDRPAAIVLTGSGSSLHAGECCRLALQRGLGVPALPLAGGALLTDPGLLPSAPLLVVSIARSGNSPETCAAVDLLLRERPGAIHLAITCCSDGSLATRYRGEPRVTTIVLDEATCDRSLVMTSSFTNLVLACRALLYLERPDAYRDLAGGLAAGAQRLLTESTDSLAEVAAGPFTSVVFLGSGDRAASAREAALKMLEMTAGGVKTLAETFLGLRHGPMSAIRSDTAVVAFLSSDPVTRAYEIDLLDELAAKRLGLATVVAGADVPARLRVRETDLLVDFPAAGPLADTLVLLDAVVGQLLAFFTCLRLGLKPDSPSAGGVITRVVKPFALYDRGGSDR